MPQMSQVFGRTGREVSRFGIVGVANTVIGLAIIFFCYHIFDLGLVLSNAIGYGIGLALSFGLNGKWTFGASVSGSRTIVAYGALVGVAFVLNIILVNVLMLLSLPYWVAQIGGVVTYSVIVFLGMKYAVFRNDH